MAREIRTESNDEYEQKCRPDTNHVRTIHRRKVTTTTTFYDDGTSRVTDIKRGDWYSTGAPC